MPARLKRDGALGWLLVVPFVLAAAFVVDPLPVQALVVLVGLGLTGLGVGVFRDTTTD